MITTSATKRLFFFALLLLMYTSGISHNLYPKHKNINNSSIPNTIIEESCLPDIIINEVDADTDGVDILEFVELYDGGAGNSTLDGLVLVFYNGSDNASYAAYDLDGHTTNAEGYFVIGNAAVPNVSIVFPSNGLQNGADAVALYTGNDADFPNDTPVTITNLVDAFVYDTDDSDDAELLILLNAGQAQINERGMGDGASHSNQRIPNGAGGARNTATYAQLEPTPGAVNGAPAPIEIIINEVDADTDGVDILEFVELYDGGVGNSTLDGLVLVFHNGSDNASYAAYDLDGHTTNAEGYFVIGNAAVPNVSIVFPSNGLQNGADAVALYTGNDTDFPNDTPVTITNLVDAFVYDTDDADDAELLILLNAGQAQINERGMGDGASHSNQRIPNGAGGARNTATYTQLEPTPGAVNGAPAPIEIIINEVDADTAGTDILEFVELYDGGVGNSTLDGLVLVFHNGSDNASYAAYDLDGHTTNAEGYFVIGNAAVSNVSIVIPSNGLQNGADAVALYTGNDTDFPNDTPVTTANLIDAFVYDTNDADDAELLILLNAGQAQVNEGGAGDKDAHSSQRIPNGAGGVRNTATYAQLEPTPGAVNGTPAPVAEIIINEVDADTAGTDTLEFVELYDGGVGNSTLDGLVLVFHNGSDNASYAAYDLDGHTTNAEGYFVIGNVAVSNVSIVIPSNGLQNGADAVALYTGNDTDFPNDTPVTITNLIDAFVYDTNDADDAELLILLNVGQAQVNEDGAGDKDAHSSQRIPNGAGGVRNTATYAQLEPTPGVVNGTPAPVAEIIINEVEADTDGSDTLEFVELFDGGTGNTSLSGFVVVFYNGNSDTSYNAFDLDGFSTNADGYFVLGNVAVPNVSLVIPNSSLQNGTDAIAIYTGDDTDFPNGTSVTTDNLVDALVYDTNDTDDSGLLVLLNAGQAQINEGGMGDSPSHSNQRIPNGSGGARNTTTYSQIEPTPGAVNGAIIPIPTVKIHEVQGSGLVAAMAGLTIRVEAIVIGDFQNNDQLSGFFIQEEDLDADTDAETSEGIFVYCDGCATSVSVGDAVTVTGLAVDFFEMTQIDVTAPNGDITINSSGNTLPSPVSIALPAGSSTEAEGTFESVEGMLINVTTNLVVSEYFELARYGQLVLSANNRIQQFTDSNEPDVAGYNAFKDQLDQSRIILDDDNNLQSDAITGAPDEPYFWPRPGASNTNFIRGGDQISNLQGIMHWSFAGQSGTDAWRIRPVEEAFTYNFTPSNPRTDAPTTVDGSFKVASFNVLNYFTTLDERGAHSNVELERQRAKIAAAICSMDADIIGLIEIENNGMTALNDLLNGTNGINATCSSTYVAIDAGIIGTDEITVAFIYNTATVTPEGAFSILDSSVDPLFNDGKNRPVLAQTFTQISNGGTLTLAVNHLKSKGSSCNSIGDPDLGDGSGNCNITRTNAATALVNWLATDPTNSGDPDFMIIGDLNSYRNESPIDALKLGADGIDGTSDDFVDLLDAYLGASAYSYVFDGQLGYLDYALASQSLIIQITGATAWHINSDEAAIFDYNDGIQDPGEASFHRKSNALSIYEANSFRASDHDPLLVGINLGVSPIISCLDDVTSFTDEGICGAIVLFSDANAIDPDGDLMSVVQSDGQVSGSLFPVGDSIIEFTATDLAGNVSICSFTITVIDNEPANTICEDITIQLDEFGDVAITVNDIDGGSSDNCGIESITISQENFGCDDVGTNNVILTITDVNGNISSCTAIVTVEDVTPPVTVCNNITVELDVNGIVTVLGSDVGGASTDVCGIDSYELNMDTFDCNNIGDNSVILTVTDVNGNQSTCSVIVTVEDNTAPELVCMDVTIELNEDGIAFIIPSNLVETIDDSCGILVFTADVSEVSCADIGSPITVNIFASDNNGNSSFCSSTITVVDTLGPEIVCPPNEDVNLDPNGSYTLGDYIADGLATATDNCTNPVTIFSQDPLPGTQLGFGIHNITFSAEDEYGNVSTCSFELDVDVILGESDNTLNLKNIVMYPNPASDYVTLNNPEEITLINLEVFDIKGRLIQTIDLSTAGNETRIDVSQLSRATYLIKINGENGHTIKQLIKK